VVSATVLSVVVEASVVGADDDGMLDDDCTLEDDDGMLDDDDGMLEDDCTLEDECELELGLELELVPAQARSAHSTPIRSPPPTRSACAARRRAGWSIVCPLIAFTFLGSRPSARSLKISLYLGLTWCIATMDS
jgi:hypothetical protein